jgi:hypothetical protein
MPNSDNLIDLLTSQAELSKTTGTALGNQAELTQREKNLVCEFCLLLEFFLSNLNILFSLNLMFQILNGGILPRGKKLFGHSESFLTHFNLFLIHSEPFSRHSHPFATIPMHSQSIPRHSQSIRSHSQPFPIYSQPFESPRISFFPLGFCYPSIE